MAKVTCVLDRLLSPEAVRALGEPNKIQNYQVKEEGSLFYVSFDTGNIFEPYDEKALREEMEFRLETFNCSLAGSLKNIIYEK